MEGRLIRDEPEYYGGPKAGENFEKLARAVF
jgi:hypothetical protein